MALKTIGTNGTTSLNGFIVGVNDVIPADLATLNNALRTDPPTVNTVNVGTAQQRLNQAYVKDGWLFVPNRGNLKLIAGDWVCWDTTTGWPIVISQYTAANGPYTHS